MCNKNDRRARTLALAFALAAALVGFGSACAQSYPNKPVRMVIGSAPGSGNDIAGRILAARISESWGQQIVMIKRGQALRSPHEF